MATTKKNSARQSETTAQRVAEINQLYQDLRKLFQHWMSQAETPNAATPKQLLSKMSEITSAHFLVLKAEEAFHDKQDSTTPQNDNHTDLEHIRAELECKLSRLHDSLAKSDVFEDTK